MSDDNREGGSVSEYSILSTLIVRRKLLISCESGTLYVGRYSRTRSYGGDYTCLVSIFYGLL